MLAPREAALVDADAEVGAAGLERRHDVGEHYLLHGSLACMEEFVEQGGGGVGARTQHAGGPRAAGLRDGAAGMAAGTRCEQQRTYAEAESRSDRQHAKGIAQEEGRVKAGLRGVEVASEQPPVQVFDIEQLDAEVEAAWVHLSFQIC